MDAQTTTMMRCTACGALAKAECACGVPYEPLSQAQRVERRRGEASKLYKRGETMEQIADKLKVTARTISEDLRDFEDSSKSNHPKTATNPRGAGRPKKVRPPKPPGVKQAQRSIDLLPEVWEQVKVRAAAANMPAAEFIGQLLTVTIDPTIDPKTLSRSGQDRLAAAIRQHQKKLDREFELRVQAATKERTDKLFPMLQKLEDEARLNERIYREFMQKQKKIMTVAEYTLVCSLLHPDSRISASDERLRRAFQMFEPKIFALTGEK